MAKKSKKSKKSKKRKYAGSSGKDVKSEMHRYKRGTAKSGPGGKGGKVKSRKQAIAIGQGTQEGQEGPKEKELKNKGASHERAAPSSRRKMGFYGGRERVIRANLKGRKCPSLCPCRCGIASATSCSTSSWTITRESRPHRSLNQWLESHPLYDWLLAPYQNTRRNARLDREFKEGARRFPSEPGAMGAFAEAHYFAWEKRNADQHLPAKGHSLHADEILNDAERARPFW